VKKSHALGAPAARRQFPISRPAAGAPKELVFGYDFFGNALFQLPHLCGRRPPSRPPFAPKKFRV